MSAALVESDPPLLAVEGLQVRFPHAAGELRALDGVSLELHQGRTLGIVGESGSGKSVLARSVMHILAPTARVAAGRVSFRGTDITGLRRRDAKHLWGKDIAMVFQDPMTSLTPTVKVGRQITEPLRYHLGMDRATARKRALDLLEEVGIPEAAKRLDQYPHELSGGMRQRVTIAIAVACGPLLLIADEPTTALDVTIQQQVLNTLTRLTEQHQMAMILITHDLGVVASRTDSIAVMYGGRIVETAPTKVLFDEVRHPYTEGLLGSIPRVANRSHTPLTAIPGRPPLVVNPAPGCHFAPRCAYAQDRCHTETPPLQALGRPDHQVACFFPVGTPALVGASPDDRSTEHAR